MTVTAQQQIRAMRGGAQSQLMLCSDGHAYVVKFQNNPQSPFVLANEMIGTGLAAALGLTVPACRVVDVPEALIESTPDLAMESGSGRREPCVSGPQFGSRFVGGLLPGQIVDYLPEPDLSGTENLNEFAGMLVFDKWTCNADGRQAVFFRSPRRKRYKAFFIDHGLCFNTDWVLVDTPLRGVYARNAVYRHIQGWDSFEPWLNRLESFDPEAAWRVARAVPAEWYAAADKLEALIELLLRRKNRVRGLIDDFRHSSRAPFPNWYKA